MRECGQAGHLRNEAIRQPRALPIRHRIATLNRANAPPKRYRSATDPTRLTRSPRAYIAGSVGPDYPAIMRGNWTLHGWSMTLQLRANAPTSLELRHQNATDPLLLER